MADGSPESLEQRRERLVLQCEADRLRLKLALRGRPTRSPSSDWWEKIRHGLDWLLPFAPLLPFRLGKGLRFSRPYVHILCWLNRFRRASGADPIF